MDPLEPLEPLKISCTDTRCEDNLHCFKSTRSMPQENRGKCRQCNADLIDWDRVKSRRISDAKHTFDALKKEYIRHSFFHRDIDPYARNYAVRKGRIALNVAARSRLEKYVAPADPYRDGQQTPFNKNPIFYAQHSTATCCRTCLEYWHGIPKGRQLTEKELNYCAALIELYFEERLGDLADEGRPVRSIAT